MATTLKEVSSFRLGLTGTAVLRAQDLLWVAPGEDPRVIASDVTAFCLSPDGTTLVHAAGIHGEVSALGLGATGEAISWPAVGAMVCVIAADAQGRVAVGTADERALFGSVSGAWVREIELEKVPEDIQDLFSPEARAVGLLPNGTGIAVSGNGDLHLLDARLAEVGGTKVDTLAYEGPVTITPLSDSRFLAGSGRLVLVHAPDGSVLATHTGALGFSRDLRTFLREDEIVLLSPCGDVERTLPKPEGARSVDREGEMIVVGSADGSVAWLSTEDGTVLDAARAAPRAVLEVQAAHGMVAALDGERTLRIAVPSECWATRAPWKPLAPRRTFALGRTSYAATWASDGKSFGVRGERFSIHDAGDGRELACWDGGTPMDLWYAHGLWLAYFRDRIELYDGATLEPRGGDAVAPHNLSFVATLPDGVLLRSTAGLVSVSANGAVHPIDTGMRMKNGLMHHWLSRVTVSESGRHAAASPVDRDGVLVTLPGGAWVRDLAAKNGAWMFSPDGRLLLDGHGGAIFRVDDGMRVGQCGHGRGAAVWSPDGRTILRSDEGGAWLCGRGGDVIHPIAGGAGGRGLFSPDGARAAVVLASSVLLLDGATGACVGSPLPFGRPALARFLSPDRLLLWPNTVGADDPTAWLVDARSGQLLAPLQPAMDGSVHWSCPLVVGGKLVLATPNQDPWLFSLEDGSPIGRLPLGRDPALRTLATSDLGDLLTLTGDGSIRIW